MANDLDQSVGRVFATMTALLKHNPVLGASATIRATEIQLSNGTTIRAISSDYRGAAGSRHSLVIFDELWGFTLERAERLFEELTPPPTEPNAWVLIVTTAGFTGESVLLERLYSRGLAGERLDPELEVYRADDLVMFWSHVPRQPWQTGEVGARYYAEQRRLLRPNTFARLHENRWTSAESAFVTAEQYDACLEPTWSALDPTKAHPLWVGVDASTKRDSTAVVAVLRDEVENLVVVAQHRVWTPSAHHPVDLEAVESYLLDLARQYDLRTVRLRPVPVPRLDAAAPAARPPDRGVPADRRSPHPHRPEPLRPRPGAAIRRLSGRHAPGARAGGLRQRNAARVPHREDGRDQEDRRVCGLGDGRPCRDDGARLGGAAADHAGRVSG